MSDTENETRVEVEAHADEDPFAAWPQPESGAVIEDLPEEGTSVEHVEGEIEVPDGYQVIGQPERAPTLGRGRRLALQRRPDEPDARPRAGDARGSGGRVGGDHC